MKGRTESPPSRDVFGFGHCCVDYLCVLDPYPEKGRKGVVVQALVCGGGPIPTALKTLAKFGKSARFCGRVGDDEGGRLIRDELREWGVDASPVVVSTDAATARAFIWIDRTTGERTVALDRTGLEWLKPGEFDAKLAGDCRVFLSDGRATTANLEALQVAKAAGVVTVFDAGSIRERMDEMLPLIDYAVVSRDLADTLLPGASPEELARELLRRGAANAVVTDGRRGAVWCGASGEGEEAGFEVTPIVDTTGAGDVFHGAFIYGLLEGWELRRSVRFANAAAALSCRKLSGSAGIPELEEVLQIINSSPPTQ